MKRVIFLTGAELRHSFMRRAIALQDGIEVLCSYCEGAEKSLAAQAQAKPCGTAELELRHAAARATAEQDFFAPFLTLTPDYSAPRFIAKGEINEAAMAEQILNLAPDLLVAYGCSIIRGPLLEKYKGRFLNLHLGLSPWYRGAGTNFWPFVNGEPEFVGATFMHLDAGVDTGEIIHQIRAQICPGDDIHRIGSRLIATAAKVYADLILQFDDLVPMTQPAPPAQVRIYRKKDFTDAAIIRMQEAFDGGLIQQYLRDATERCAKVPLISNPALTAERLS